MRLAGVDGCRNGWIVALAADWPDSAPVQIDFRATFAEVIDLTRPCLAVAVDMPIGLPDGADPRACDLEARKALGGQRSSVFLAPPRACLDAGTPEEFQRIHRELRGIGAGLPVWGIVPKMREVNLLLERDPALQNRIFEFHPELTWRRLAGRDNLASKKTAAGILDRIGVLNRNSGAGWTPAAHRAITGKPAIDDVLDAIAGLAAAQAFLAAGHRPAAPRNAAGLRMEIWR